MISQIVAIQCDWCHEVEQRATTIQPAIEYVVAHGWIIQSDRHFCGAVCRDKDATRREIRT